jgi:membrane protein DedA with SNARE-associated domain
MGLRAAAFLTAGIAHVPFWKFLVIDAAAALVGVPVVFGLAYFFTAQIQSIVGGVHRAERWIGLGVLIVLLAVFSISAWRWNRRLDEESLGIGRSPRS